MATAGPRRTPTSTDAGQAVANLKPAFHQSLLLKQALFVSAVVLLTTATLGWVSYGFAQNTLRDLIHKRLRLVVAEEFDVVLMDIQMPVMDGLQAAAAIRQREVHTGRRTPSSS
ncbi:MAG: response regulator [Planctomycetaceae bacterium]